MKIPPFAAPEPMDGEMINQWHRRTVWDLERYVNDELVPAIVAAVKKEANG